MKILLPDNIDFEVRIESEQKLTSKVLIFNSKHYLLNILEEESGNHIFTEKWTLENKNWILRRHITLENTPIEDFHYFVFLVTSRFLNSNFQIFVNDSKLEMNLKK